MDVHFFRSMPKLELHAHLSGSISRQTLHEVWLLKKEKGETDLPDPLIEMPDGKCDYNLETFFPLFSSYIYALCSDLPSLIHTTNSVLSDFAADGVVYLELRTTPRAIPSAGITKERYLETILGCIAAHNAAQTSMKTNLILSIDRRNDLPTALQVVELAQSYRSSGVVGIDLCGDPSHHPISHLSPAFTLAHSHHLPVTLHFGESALSSSSADLLELLSWHPARLGHVIHIPAPVKQEIVRRGLALELCLSCNVHAGMIEGGYGEHHVGWWWGTGCPVILGTDDIGIFLSPLSTEYALLARHFSLARSEILAVARSGMDSIFGDEADKQRLRDVMWV